MGDPTAEISGGAQSMGLLPADLVHVVAGGKELDYWV